MASVSNEQFLFSCIANSNNGTVNFQKVSEECGIVSKGAATIKFRRLRDQFGTATSGSNSPAAGGEGGEEEAKERPKKKTPAKKTPTKKTPAKEGGGKKRKLSEADDAEATPVKDENEEDVGLLACVLNRLLLLPATGVDTVTTRHSTAYESQIASSPKRQRWRR
ncbi:hypothetical protein LTR37_005927 [Vermiconidia calcicola]|uniref:Uncharacterized protein n=1 Tax=Vermiconidia calcicola TaxID=1690605 RepID=A0ACC3NJ16_9PEZI|nr:hypothetical protein LTR37_005927 [Vermiconidia calcicola]